MAIALPLVSSRNVEEVVTFLKTQLVKTREEQQDKVCLISRRLITLSTMSTEYRISPDLDPVNT